MGVLNVSEILIANNTNDDIVVTFPYSSTSLVINSKQKKRICLRLSEESIFIVRNYYSNETVLEKVLGILISFFISIPLWYTYCIEDNSVKKTIKCSTIFNFNSILVTTNNEIIVNESLEPLTAFEIIFNKIHLKGNSVFFENEIEENLKSYNKSHNILWAFPIIVVFILLICTLTNQKIAGSLILLCVLLVIIFIFLQKKKKIKNELLTIAKTIPKYETHGDGSVSSVDD